VKRVGIERGTLKDIAIPGVEKGLVMSLSKRKTFSCIANRDTFFCPSFSTGVGTLPLFSHKRLGIFRGNYLWHCFYKVISMTAPTFWTLWGLQKTFGNCKNVGADLANMFIKPRRMWGQENMLGESLQN
jgi:hypothetical protein